MMDDWWTAKLRIARRFFHKQWSAGRVGRARPLICPDTRATLIAILLLSLGLWAAIRAAVAFGFSCKAIA
jgi:hypothetical protein